jgi:hypothetical protein
MLISISILGEDGWTHLERILETTIPIMLFMWNNRRKAKKEAEAKAEALKIELNARHEQNQGKLDAILFDQIYLVPHDHLEARIANVPPETPLTVGGIMRRPNGKKT